MKGDFSRDSFHPTRRFSRVLMQQGRVQLDADWNEQVAIQLHYLRSLAADLIGPHGGAGEAFRLGQIVVDGTPVRNDFLIAQGHYYVDGWLCDNAADVRYGWQPAERQLPAVPELENGKRYLAYLDVWERHVSSAEADGEIEIERRRPWLLRDPALGGADTASRAQVVWQVKVSDRIVLPDGDVPVPYPPAGGWVAWVEENWPKWIESWQGARRGSLQAEARTPEADGERGPCVIPPEARYRGFENQLYRVEIHRGGAARVDGGEGGATFKMSRENGSVVFPIQTIAGARIRLASWWRDDRLGLGEGDRVELVDDASVLANRADPLRRVAKVDRDEMTVTLDAPPAIVNADPALHPVLRRWDHRARASGDGGAAAMADDDALFVTEDAWIPLEAGIRVKFRKAADGSHRYRTGDFWLIPARTTLGDVLWPKRVGGGSQVLEPIALPPHGVEHHYAPLGIVSVGLDGQVVVDDLRRTFEPLAKS